jgi:addiction module HigA family antidote
MNSEVELLPLVTPGEILAEEFLAPLGMSPQRVAKDLGVSPRRINEIVHGSRAITPDTALRLAMYLGTTPHFWMNLQTDYELRRLHREGPLPSVRRCEKLPATS